MIHTQKESTIQCKWDTTRTKYNATLANAQLLQKPALSEPTKQHNAQSTQRFYKTACKKL